MVRVGGFLKTQNRIRRQRARGRFISPYQVGDGALSFDAYVLSPGGSHDPQTIETTPPDERGHHFWHVHSHAHGGSHAGPRGRPRKS